MCANNAISPNNDIIFCGDYHAAVAKPAILFNDYSTSGTKSLFHDWLVHVQIFVIVISDKYAGSHQYVLSDANLIYRRYHRPAPYLAAPANNDSGFRALWNNGDVHPHVGS
jgi:hypothetical protein